MGKCRIPRKMKKRMKKDTFQPPSKHEVKRFAEEATLKNELKRFVAESRIKVGDTVRIGKGKTEWNVTEGYTNSLTLRSASGAIRHIPRSEVDTLSLVDKD